jgi:hypothetical protein
VFDLGLGRNARQAFSGIEAQVNKSMRKGQQNARIRGKTLNLQLVFKILLKSENSRLGG